MTRTTMMTTTTTTMIRSPQNVRSILLSREHIHYNASVMEK
jgi:hypothetical protein